MNNTGVASRAPAPKARTACDRRGALEVLLVAARLGLTSFGGPVAHLGYFRQEYVVRRAWLDEAQYADLVALCQFLPGPASSQVGIAVGIERAGLPGGIAAWCGFTLPSAIALTIFAVLVRNGTVVDAGLQHGLQVAAVAVVAQAIWGMARSLCPDRDRATIAVLAAIAALLIESPLTQLAIIVAGGLLGWRLLPAPDPVAAPPVATSSPIGRRLAASCWAVLVALLLGLPLLRHATQAHAIALCDSFFRAGALVFGGGHVVLPLLQQAVVPPGWVGNAAFATGYGAAQAVSGPLFTFAAYLGAVETPAPNGAAGAAIALIAIFAPSFLLVVGALPFWALLRSRPAAQAALRGINAGVVGLLGAALYTPLWTGAILAPRDLALALAAFGALLLWKAPPWLVVAVCAATGAAFAHI